MEKFNKILVLGMLSIVMFSGLLRAEERKRETEVKGTFIQQVEREVGERVYMGVVIKPHDRDDHITILVPRQREELWQTVRRLREGQQVSVYFITEAGHNWIGGMEVERRNDIEQRPDRRRTDVRREVFRYKDGPERREAGRPENPERIYELRRILSSNLDRMEQEFREIRMHIERLEREVQRLRNENEKLRRELHERAVLKREREREVRVRPQREDRGQEEREGRRESEAGRALGERPVNEREVVLHQLEVMRMALAALREGERGNAAELLNLAIRASEMMLEGRKDQEARRIREQAPDHRQLAEVLSMAANLWREFGHTDKAEIVEQLAKRLSSPRDPQIREKKEIVVRRRSEEQRDINLPECMTGFRGVLVGRVLLKLDRGFVLKVERVEKVWESNRADRPEAAVGKELIIDLGADEESVERFLNTLGTLEIGARVLVEAFHFEGNSLKVVEQLKKIE